MKTKTTRKRKSSRECKLHRHGGGFLDILNPYYDDIQIDDIATGLSRISRWASQSLVTMTVAAHSVIVSHEVPPEYALSALLHDASEAYICDIPKPLKAFLPGYRSIERTLMDAIYATFEAFPDQAGRAAIDLADTAARNAEQSILFPDRYARDPDLKDSLRIMTSMCAGMLALNSKEMFLRRFLELSRVS